MSGDFPDFIDPWKAAEGHRVLHGTMPLKRMRRLSLLLASAEGEAGFEACFYFDPQRNAIIKVSVEADLLVLCQRSLAPYTETVQRTSVLAVMRDFAEQEMMPANYEPLILESGEHEAGKLDMLELIEDELLLALPQIPKNPAVDEIELSTDSETGPLCDDADERQQRPFAGLAALLEKS